MSNENKRLLGALLVVLAITAISLIWIKIDAIRQAARLEEVTRAGDERRTERLREERRIREMLAWEPIPRQGPPIPNVPLMATPSAPPLPNPLGFYISHNKESGCENMPSVMLIEWIIESHPDPEISEELLTLIRCGDVGFRLGMGQVGEAVFMMERLPPEGVAELGLEEVPLFAFNPEAVEAARHGGFELLWIWAVMYHEFQHYKQWRDATDPIERESFNGSTYGRDRMTPAECAYLWEHEFEAYKAEVKLTRDWGLHMQIPQMREMMEAMQSEDTYRQHLFGIFMSHKSETLPECISTWGTLAHHPNAEEIAELTL